MTDLKDLRTAIAHMIEEYLAGILKPSDLIQWATENSRDERVQYPQSIDYWIVQDAIWAIRMMTAAEPPEYRTTLAELKLTLKYLKNEAEFPKERIPADNLRDLKLQLANLLERYLRRQVSVSVLVSWSKYVEDLLANLELLETLDYRVLQHGLAMVSMLALDPDILRPSRSDVWLTIRYLRGTLPYPEE